MCARTKKYVDRTGAHVRMCMRARVHNVLEYMGLFIPHMNTYCPTYTFRNAHFRTHPACAYTTLQILLVAKPSRCCESWLRCTISDHCIRPTSQSNLTTQRRHPVLKR